MTCTAWNLSVIGRRLKFTSSTGISQDVALTAVSTGTLTYAIALAGLTGGNGTLYLTLIRQWSCQKSIGHMEIL